MWDTATRRLPESILDAIDRVGRRYHPFLPAPGNLNIIKATVDKLGIPARRAPGTVDLLGNTGSAGVFTALYQSFSRQVVRRTTPT